KFDRTSSVRSDFFCFYIIFTLCSLGSRGSEDFLHLIGLCPKFQLKLKFISWYNNFCVKEKFQHGPLVKRLRHRPFTAVTRVRVPYGSLFILIYQHGPVVQRLTCLPVTQEIAGSIPVGTVQRASSIRKAGAFLLCRRG